ncbi:RNA-binding protein 20 [Boleophthalmus pectinirostris]|uniref:RNA-binding protein 20 n=1 Tax=Boleophthalmus pectinirostris TaxID=150288 RepID=UPI00242F6615|nr:RNA-binding protein 20 [Boleophthalmus pectinirostris]
MESQQEARRPPPLIQGRPEEDLGPRLITEVTPLMSAGPNGFLMCQSQRGRKVAEPLLVSCSRCPPRTALSSGHCRQGCGGCRWNWDCNVLELELTGHTEMLGKGQSVGYPMDASGELIPSSLVSAPVWTLVCLYKHSGEVRVDVCAALVAGHAQMPDRGQSVEPRGFGRTPTEGLSGYCAMYLPYTACSMGSNQRGYCSRHGTSFYKRSLSSGPVDSTSKKGLLQGNVPTTAPPQSQLLLTPASLQLAQLQAQLTLQRLKLAQGGSPASAAVLNQVLSSVAMSQPLFNHLRTSSMVGNPQSTFTTGVLGFPSSNSTLNALAGGVFYQSSNSLHPNQPIRGGTGAQQTMDYGKKTGSAYPSDTDRRAQYNMTGGTSATASTDRQYSLVNTQVKHLGRDLYGKDIKGQQAGFNLNEQNVYNSAVQSDHWKGSVSHTGNCEASNTNPLWTSSGQPLCSRPDLYNPEEPTSDPKFNSSGLQGFGGYQPLHGNEELKILQPHQVSDYYAITPSQLPHQCSICDKKVYNLKDWEQHVKGKLHLQNKTQYSSESSAVASTGGVHYAVGRPSEAPVNLGQTNSMVYTTTGQDGSSGGSSSFLPAATMKTYPLSDTGFTPLQLDPKSFPPRKGAAGRVVHICNLPEGSCTENDVINLGLPFGKVTNYILMRSTHQAFLEMAYVEAALAMVQYYQLTPAMINNQKLLIRMSKRYNELQLKKPGKDVETIIHDITSQREREEIQEHEHYVSDRARSRSPISRSLSPHIHSPGFTCDTPETSQGGVCRGAERGTNGLNRNSWEWSSLPPRRTVDERVDPWQDECCPDEDRVNGWGTDSRKSYRKLTDHMNLRCAEERGGTRDWHPQRMSYRNVEDSYYTKEQMYKTDKPLRPPYQRHDPKSKRRDADYHRPRHSELDTSSEPPRAEDKRGSPERGRSKKTSKKHSSTERHSKEHTMEQTDRHSKEKSATPQHSTPQNETNDCEKIECERNAENTEDTDEECWYPKNMEELVTVDEVGGEDDIVEPDLPELEESPHKESVHAVQQHDVSADDQGSVKEAGTEEKTNAEVEPKTFLVDEMESNKSTVSPEEPKLHTSTMKDLNYSQWQFKAMIEDNDTTYGDIQREVENHVLNAEEDKGQETEPILNGAQIPQDIEALLPSGEQDKAVNEHSIPLGVEFIVPQAGFYCKLCSLFYTSEETAKAAHCRSVVHYRNLQKYLSHLAEESLLGQFSGTSLTQ